MELVAIRTNTRFNVSYETSKLEPSIELIFLFGKPKYGLKNKEIVKGTEVNEFRIETTLQGINHLIGQLQATVAGLNTFDQMASAINTIIVSSQPPVEEKKD